MRISMIIIFLMLFTFSSYANSWNTADHNVYTKILHLLICTEDASILCKHFNMTKESAKRQVEVLCDNDKARLKAIWENDRIKKIICRYPSPTNAQCLANGFDCALDGQCVIDAALRPNAQSQPDYYQAMSDVATTPSNFVYYPHIFYVCSVK